MGDYMKEREERIRDRYQMFKSMAEVLESRVGDRFELRKFTIDEEKVKMARLTSSMRGSREYDELIPGDYIQLIDKKLGEIVMSDTPMEKSTNMDLYQHANGDVLIGGLGIGMILLAIQDKPEVKSITVIEKFEEIMVMVKEQLPINEKVIVINADIFEWVPDKGTKYDTIYIDIWNNICGDFWEEHKKLNRKFSKYLNKENPNAWAGSWRKKDFQQLARESKSQSSRRGWY
jgi:hypothetical protein